MKIFILLFFSFSLFAADKGLKDYSLTTDKQLHFGVSFLLSDTFESLLEINSDLTNKEKILLASSLSFSIGLAKEFKDSSEPNNYFSTADLTYDLFGSILGSLTSFYIHRYINKDIDLSFNENKNLFISYKF